MSNQVIVIGGGLAGMSAAHTVIQQGGKYSDRCAVITHFLEGISAVDWGPCGGSGRI